MNYPFKEIKEHYRLMDPHIIDAKINWYFFYTMDWMSLMSPIEQDAWMAIRCYGRISFYPQYPVDKYFLDFANPFLKIGIECDGKAFHQDKAKDLIRDTHLSKLGWIIYRISGADCVRICEDYSNRDDIEDKDEKYRVIENHYRKTIEGLLLSIGVIHCGFNAYDLTENEIKVISYNVLNQRISVKTGNDFRQLYLPGNIPTQRKPDDDNDGWVHISKLIAPLPENNSYNDTNPF